MVLAAVSSRSIARPAACSNGWCCVPSSSAFQQVLRERVATLAGIDDERFAGRARSALDEEGRLTVVSEFIAGRRLSEVLDAAVDAGIAPGIDAALGLLLELLPALGNLHGLARFAHGSIAPGRVLFTPACQLVLLDAIYAAPLERLQFNRQRLWSSSASRLPRPPARCASTLPPT